jgi:small subunit ribosomal protein S9
MADDMLPEDEDLALPDATEDLDDSSAGATQSLNIGGEAPESVVERPAPIIRGKLDKHGIAMGTGRRKTAVARVRIKDGSGKILINGRELTEFFPLERDRNMVKAPLIATEQADKVDVWVRVAGGGPTGQTGAAVLGIARALSARNNALQPKLAEGGYLTRDGRMVERKKYGHKKARRSFQFSKR